MEKALKVNIQMYLEICWSNQNLIKYSCFTINMFTLFSIPNIITNFINIYIITTYGEVWIITNLILLSLLPN